MKTKTEYFSLNAWVGLVGTVIILANIRLECKCISNYRLKFILRITLA
jgi:hypothetical protein